MSDFLQRLAERTLGSAVIVQPLIASRFTSQLATQGQSQLSGESPALPVASPPTAAPAPMPPASPSRYDGPHRNGLHRIGPPDNPPAARGDALLPQPMLNPSAVGEGPAETARPNDRRAATERHRAEEVAGASPPIGSAAQPPAAFVNPIAEGIRAAPVLTLPEANTSVPSTFRLPEAPGREDARLIAAEPGSARLEQAERRQRAEPLMPTAPLDLDVERPEIDAHRASTEPAVIQVTIGRIEIRASVSAPPVRKMPPQSPTIGLDEYLRHRQGGQR